ncbi:MAG: hypothetical protein ABW006_03705, partial [Hyphomicrobium sp.]
MKLRRSKVAGFYSHAVPMESDIFAAIPRVMGVGPLDNSAIPISLQCRTHQFKATFPQPQPMVSSSSIIPSMTFSPLF